MDCGGVTWKSQPRAPDGLDATRRAYARCNSDTKRTCALWADFAYLRWVWRPFYPDAPRAAFLPAVVPSRGRAETSG